MARVVTRRKTPRQTAVSLDKAVKAVAVATVVVCLAIVLRREFGKPAPTPPGAPDGESARPAEIGRTEKPSRPASAQDADGREDGGGAGDAAFAKADSAPREFGENAGSPAAADAAGGEAHPEDAPQVLVAPFRSREFFDNDVENTIAVISKPGVDFFDFPPRIGMSEDEVLAFLRRPVEIMEDDDEEAVAAKERTADFKTRALKAIEEEGLTFDQFVRDVVHLRKEQYEMREDARLEMIDILETRGEGAAREYLNVVNAELKAQGLDEIALPRHLVEELAGSRRGK